MVWCQISKHTGSCKIQFVISWQMMMLVMVRCNTDCRTSGSLWCWIGTYVWWRWQHHVAWQEALVNGSIGQARMRSGVGYAMGAICRNLAIWKWEIASAKLFSLPGMCITQTLMLCWAARKYKSHTRAIILGSGVEPFSRCQLLHDCCNEKVFVTESMKIGLMAYGQVLRKAFFIYWKCWSSPMLKLRVPIFHKNMQQFLTFKSIL